jgi:hypothetical protein
MSNRARTHLQVGGQQTRRSSILPPSIPTNRLPAHEVGGTSELLEQIIELCDWPTLTSLGCVSHHLRLLRQRVLRMRVLYFLSRFIPLSSITRFMELLDSTFTVVFGGIVRCIMSAGNATFYEIFPNQLHLAVPNSASCNAIEGWRRFFQGRGFLLTYDGESNSVYETISSRTLTLTHQVYKYSLKFPAFIILMSLLSV